MTIVTSRLDTKPWSSEDPAPQRILGGHRLTHFSTLIRELTPDAHKTLQESSSEPALTLRSVVSNESHGPPVEAQCEHRTDLGADSLSRYAIWRGCLLVMCARPALRTISTPPLGLTLMLLQCEHPEAVLFSDVRSGTIKGRCVLTRPLTHHRLHTIVKGSRAFPLNLPLRSPSPEFIMSKQSSANVEPELRSWNKFLKLSATPEANRVARSNENRVLRAREPSVVRKEAITRLPTGLRTNHTAILGATTLEFGVYHGETFRWALENATGWVVGVVAQVMKEPEVDSFIGVNKKLLERYALTFPLVKGEVQYKLASLKSAQDVLETGDVGLTLVRFGEFRALSWRELSTSGRKEHRRLCEYVLGKKDVQRSSTMGEFKSYLREQRCGAAARRTSPRKTSAPAASSAAATPGPLLRAISRSTPASSSEPLLSLDELQSGGTTASKRGASFGDSDEDTLVQLTQEAERAEEERKGTQTGPSEFVQPLVIRDSDASKVALRKEWLKTLPPEDHVWVANALFTESGRLKSQLQMWWHPPQPALVYSQPPATPNVFFHHRFFLWMPYRMLAYPFLCSQPGCDRRQLSSCGLYKTVRRVIDQVDDYYMGTEYLECGKCHRKLPAWSQEILEQLDICNRLRFPAVLSYHLALDRRVVAELRDRSLGNSATRLYRKLSELHYHDYMERVLNYHTVMHKFSAQFPAQTAVKEVPAYRRVPSARWLLSVYVADCYTRLAELKGNITSIFGTVLKMDSTKRVVRKLSGSAKGTAAWSTNVGNEHGQVLMSVLTASEGRGLQEMARGLVSRYQAAGVPPPQLLYVDRDCCGKFHMWAKDLFPQWENLLVRLDIWHFMRRLASCVTTESHPLYGTFMSRLSVTIFRWDVQALRQAKASQLRSRGRQVSPASVELTAKELARHCRRETRGAAETEALLDEVLTAFMEDLGRETLGVQLFGEARLKHTWAQQRAHVACIQDPPGFSLYRQVGSKSKGGVRLPVYRCARGSTSTFRMKIQTLRLEGSHVPCPLILSAAYHPSDACI
ncbi:hypothetical protein RRG08_062160 [Elysia crispata]|uniref:DUF6729 domain-containing protein n=1 Tax=Elysia crispata TaxID=231223 RepID=A0AAE0YZH0_9GAST|nr:hypothetical protein RRG08_062160 [Elysia crispata]